MHVINVRNVCQALPLGLHYLTRHGVREDSRNGPVLVAPGPVTTATYYPTERVLLSATRDANPFFHLVEAIWMLAGRDDSASLVRFVKRFADYAEPGPGHVHGAYGYRWRTALGFDQLNAIVERLRRDSTSRQAVIQMWDARCEPDAGCDDLLGDWRDRPCNTHVYLRVRNSDLSASVLDITVCCRSNDAVWGCHGANAVHFSVLQEYLAARIGIGVGVMYQVSNNYHVYVNVLDKLTASVPVESLLDDGYCGGGLAIRRDLDLKPSPMFDAPSKIDQDVDAFMRYLDYGSRAEYANSWFKRTLERALDAHDHYRMKVYDQAINAATSIGAPDWRAACVEWLQRRVP